MNEAELNRKLAEWTGAQGVCWSCKGDTLAYSSMGVCSVCKGTGKIPLANRFICPNFTSSLDACFGWLVPKLHALQYSLYAHIGKTLTTWVLSPYVSTPGSKSHEAQDENPTLALCLAIEKLIARLGKDEAEGH